MSHAYNSYAVKVCDARMPNSNSTARLQKINHIKYCIMTRLPQYARCVIFHLHTQYL